MSHLRKASSAVLHLMDGTVRVSNFEPTGKEEGLSRVDWSVLWRGAHEKKGSLSVGLEWKVLLSGRGFVPMI